MKYIFASLWLLLSFGAQAHNESAASDSRFFANVSLQRQAPEAFVLQPEAAAFILNLEKETADAKGRLIQAIQSDAVLFKAIQEWSTLSIEAQIPFLTKVFALEVQALGIQAPELIIDNLLPGQAAYFDFDVAKPTSGRVILNPQELATMDKYASLALLIHETRHSAQFQKAFLSAGEASPSAKAYRAAFIAQKELPIKSFCDFLTLASEHEAFDFGNYVLGTLTNWSVDMPDMGTYASQYDRAGKKKMDLVFLLNTDPSKTLLEKFNTAEVAQCQLLGACPK